MFGTWNSVKKVGNPSKPGMYLVSIEFETPYAGIIRRYVDCLEYTPDAKWVDIMEYDEEEVDAIIAWMPLPEPYGGPAGTNMREEEQDVRCMAKR